MIIIFLTWCSCSGSVFSTCVRRHSPEQLHLLAVVGQDSGVLRTFQTLTRAIPKLTPTYSIHHSTSLTPVGWQKNPVDTMARTTMSQVVGRPALERPWMATTSQIMTRMNTRLTAPLPTSLMLAASMAMASSSRRRAASHPKMGSNARTPAKHHHTNGVKDVARGMTNCSPRSRRAGKYSTDINNSVMTTVTRVAGNRNSVPVYCMGRCVCMRNHLFRLGIDPASIPI